MDLTRHTDLLMLVVGLGLLYAASRAAVDALVRADEAAPGWRAIGHQLPVAAVAVAATWIGEPGLAVGVLFGTSVASLSLGCGAIAVSAEHPIVAPGGWRRVWPFVIAVALLGLMAGFSGYLTLWHAGVFAMEGVVLALLWSDGAGGEANGGGRGGDVRGATTRSLILLLAFVLAVTGAWATARAAVSLAEGARALTIGTVAATMIGPMLVLPMLGTGTALANRQLGGAAVTSQVGVVLLNLCLWLPVVVIGTHYLPDSATTLTEPGTSGAVERATTLPATTQATTGPSTRAATRPGEVEEEEEAPGERQLVYPVLVWRVDTVVLLVCGLILLPAAIGRWTLSRRDGLLLLLLYVAYLMVVAAAGRR